jgi:hypothetical protein
VSLDPVILFFLLGVGARLARSDLRLPEALYEALSIYLLLAIGLKGGAQLAVQPIGLIWPAALAGVALSACIPLLTYPVLRSGVRLAAPDAASIAAHYGSVSVVTFAVAQGVLARAGQPSEPHLAVLVALMEAPGIVVGILLARLAGGAPAGAPNRAPAIGPWRRWAGLAHEVAFGKAVVLLVGGLLIGWISGPEALAPIEPLFSGLFKGVLALFLLEMGLVAGARLPELKQAGVRLVAFGLLAPPVLGLLGAVVGHGLGMSVPAIAILATLCASASYIAAPSAMRIAVPQANPTLSIGVSLGVTFPFNVLVGIPLYVGMARWLAG